MVTGILGGGSHPRLFLPTEMGRLICILSNIKQILGGASLPQPSKKIMRHIIKLRIKISPSLGGKNSKN